MLAWFIHYHKVSCGSPLFCGAGGLQLITMHLPACKDFADTMRAFSSSSIYYAKVSGALCHV